MRSLEEVIYKAKRIPHEETRRESEEYLEIVANQETLKQLIPVLETYFGPAFKPAGKEPCDTCDEHTEPFGGIAKNQTLYLTHKEDLPHVAMIWPWNDGRRATVKISSHFPE